MKKYKFKFGDRIRVIKLREDYHSRDTIKIGMLGTVIENGSDRPWVEFDENINGHNSYKGSNRNRTMCMWEDEIEKVEYQFTKSDLKDGDVVTYRYGDKRTLIKNTFECHDFGKSTSVLENYNEDLTMKNGNKEMDIIKVERPTGYKTVFERKEEILDKAEKRYLREVIRPFRKDIENIRKIKAGEKECLRILFEDGDTMSFKNFKKGTMYKNMEIYKKYTLKELGL